MAVDALTPRVAMSSATMELDKPALVFHMQGF